MLKGLWEQTLGRVRAWVPWVIIAFLVLVIFFPGDSEAQVVYDVTTYGAIAGDGLDDRAAIQSAITAAAGGGTVRFPSGQFDVTVADQAGDGLLAGVYVNASNINIELAAGSTLRLMDSQLTGTATGTVIRFGDQDTVISNIGVFGTGTVDFNRASNTTTASSESASGIHFWGPLTDITVEDITIINTGGMAVVGRSKSTSDPDMLRFTVSDLTIDDCAEGIVCIRCDGWDVLDNTLTDINEQDAIEPSATDNFNILRNSATNITHSCIDIFNGANNGVIRFNTCTNTASAVGPSIFLQSFGGNASTNIDISDNTITTTTGDPVASKLNGTGIGSSAFTTFDDNNITVNRNTISGTTSYGIYAGIGRNIWTIRGNNLTNIGRSGIYVEDASNIDVLSNSITNVNVEDNAFSSGVRVQDSTGVTVRGNNISDTAVATYYGIYLQTANTNTISQNVISNAQKNNIFITGTGNTIGQNYLFNCNPTDAQTATAQISLGASSGGNTIVGNRMFETRGTATCDFGVNGGSNTGTLDDNTTDGNHATTEYQNTQNLTSNGNNFNGSTFE